MVAVVVVAVVVVVVVAVAVVVVAPYNPQEHRSVFHSRSSCPTQQLNPFVASHHGLDYGGLMVEAVADGEGVRWQHLRSRHRGQPSAT